MGFRRNPKPDTPWHPSSEALHTGKAQRAGEARYSITSPHGEGPKG